MASKSLGTLTLDLVARIGGYTAGLDKAEKEAQKRAKAIEKAFDQAATGIGVALGAIPIAATAAFAAFQAAVKSVGDFQDLADMTGASAEGLASFAVAAGTAGTSMEEIASASVKLTKNLTGVDDESKAAGAALAALGLNIEEFKQLSPEEQLETVAKALGDVSNAADQTAIAMDLFGKSGAQVLPFLKALDEQGGRTVILTAEMIKQADEYADAQAKATTELKLYGQALATQAIPYVTEFTKAVTDTVKEMLGLDKGITDIRNNKGVQEFAESAVRALGFVVDAADGVVRVFQSIGTGLGGQLAAATQVLQGDFKGAYNTVKQTASDIDSILNRELFSTKLDRRLAELRKNQQMAAQENRGFTPSSGGRTYVGKTSAGSKGAKEKDPTAEAQRYLEQLQKQLEKTEELTVQEQALRDIQMGRLGQVTSAQKEQILAIAGQIDALKAQKKAEEDMKKYKEAVDKVNVSLLELQGHTAEAAAIKFDQENSALYKLFSDQGDTAMVKKLDTLKQITVATAQLNEQSKKFSDTQAALSMQEERINTNAERGAIGQLDALRQLGDVRKKYYEDLKKAADAANEAALGSGNADLVKKAEELNFQVEQLSKNLDPLADKFNTMFADEFSTQLDSVLDGTKKLDQALKDLVNNFVSSLVKLAAQDVAKSLFSGGGSATGGVGFDFGSLLSSFFGGAREMGGPVLPNTMYQVNEKGPELFQSANGDQYLMTGTESGKVLPNPGGGTQIINFNLQGEMRKTTQMQAAGEVRRQTNKASLRGY